MSENFNKHYPINVWISTIIFGPIIFCLATVIISHDKPFDFGIFGLFIFGILYGLLLSIPTLIICFFSFKYLKRKIGNITSLKFIYILISLLGMALTNYFFFGKDSYDLHKYYAGLTMTLTYGGAIIISGIINKLNATRK